MFGIGFLVGINIGFNCVRSEILISIIPLGIMEFVTSFYCVYLFVIKLKKIMEMFNRNDKTMKGIVEIQYIIKKIIILQTVTTLTTFTILSFFSIYICIWIDCI